MSGPAVVGDRAALRVQLGAIVTPRPRGGFLEVRWRLARGGMGRMFHPAERVNAAMQTILAVGAKTDVYVGVAPRTRQEGTAAAVERTHLLWADLDSPDALERLGAFPHRPTLLVASGTGCHAYWTLRDPGGLEARWIAQANRRLAYALAGDPRSCDPARILRPIGTGNHKTSPARRVELVGFAFTAYDVRELVGDLPDPPDAKPAPKPRPPRPRDAEHDVLDTIAPADYIEALTGNVADAEGKVRCPLPDHEDRTPSCHAYPDPGRGWYCYGCSRGGGIIDLAAALWNIEPRGRDYHDLRRRLAATLLGTPA